MMDVVFAAVIYTAGGFIAVEPTPMRSLACEELKVEVMQNRAAICIDFEGLLSMQENGFTMFRFEPSLEGEK